MNIPRSLASLLALAVSAVAAHATVITLDTSSLAGNPSGPFYLDFQLNDGSAAGDGNNTAVISDFNFGGGSAIPGTATRFGGAGGDLGSTVSITDTWAFNEFFQAFSPGSSLSFNVKLSDNSDGAVPDAFAFAILDGNLFNLPTLAPGSDTFVQTDLTGGGVTLHTYASVDGIAAPHIPDSGSIALLLGLGLAGVALVRRRAAA